MSNTATAVSVESGNKIYGQVKVTNSAGRTSVVVDLAPINRQSGYQRAKIVADRLNKLFRSAANLEMITPGIQRSEYVVHHVPWNKSLSNGNLLVTATAEDAAYHGMTRWYLSLVWANQIRTAIDTPALCKEGGKLQLRDSGKQGLEPVIATLHANATYYGYETAYGLTASEECWHPYDNTCAIWAMSNADTCTKNANYVPFGTYLRVTNKNNGKQIIVRVTDRGPHKRLACGQDRKMLDLSRGAAEAIGFDFQAGIIPIQIERLS